MRDTVHIPTLCRWLKELTKGSMPTKFQIIEAWQIAQTIHGLRHADDQRALDDARRDIMSWLSRTENPWNKPGDNLQVHIITPSIRRLRSWTDVELTPELSWSVEYSGRTVPTNLVRRLRRCLGKQHANLKLDLRDVL